jgi:hypothetical protein
VIPESIQPHEGPFIKFAAVAVGAVLLFSVSFALTSIFVRDTESVPELVVTPFYNPPVSPSPPPIESAIQRPEPKEKKGSRSKIKDPVLAQITIGPIGERA